MKQALRVAGANFTASRMVQEYARDFYVPALEGSLEGDDPPTVALVPQQGELQLKV